MKYAKWNNEIFIHSKNDKGQDVLTQTLADGFKLTFIFEGIKPIKQVNEELLSILLKHG